MAGQPYLLTATTLRRRRVFADVRTIGVVARVLAELEREGHWRLHGWVVMPDHVHAVATLDAGTLWTAMRLLKGRTARCLNAMQATSGAIWQPGYHDRALRRDESIRAAVLYVCANPVRAGIVSSLRDYCGWDAREAREDCLDMEACPAGAVRHGFTSRHVLSG